MGPFIVALVPAKANEFSTHTGQGFLYVLEGEEKVQVVEHTYPLAPGDAIYCDSSEPHSVKCAGIAPAGLLAAVPARPIHSRR